MSVSTQQPKSPPDSLVSQYALLSIFSTDPSSPCHLSLTQTQLCVNPLYLYSLSVVDGLQKMRAVMTGRRDASPMVWDGAAAAYSAGRGRPLRTPPASPLPYAELPNAPGASETPRTPPANPDAPGVSEKVSGMGGASRWPAKDVTTSTKDTHGVLVERDPSYDDMLKHMVGRITTKPGGKPEMGEASIVEQYKRPLPKVRTSEPEPGQGGHRQLPPGTLHVGHIQEIIQLYQAESGSHDGSMSVDEIASRFRVEASVVRGIVQFVSLPQDESTEKKDEQREP